MFRTSDPNFEFCVCVCVCVFVCLFNTNYQDSLRITNMQSEIVTSFEYNTINSAKRTTFIQ